MDFYYGSVCKKHKDLALCQFSIPEYGLLCRSMISDRDEILLEFSSLFLMFEFILMNPLFFRDIRTFSVYGSNAKVLQYIKNDKNIPKNVILYRQAFDTFAENVINKLGVHLDFLKISKEENSYFFNITSMKTDNNIALKLTALSKEYIHDKNKDWQ